MTTLSIYIPRISMEHNSLSIDRHMKEHGIGIVSCVDFTPINKKPGFCEKVENVRSAFVHFKEHLNSLIYMKNDGFWETIATGQPYKLQISQCEYWLCLKNNNPIQRTMMNIHQVVENGRHLENLIESQVKTLEIQANKIEELEMKFEKINEIVFQLLGGSFHQRDQYGVLSHLLYK